MHMDKRLKNWLVVTCMLLVLGIFASFFLMKKEYGNQAENIPVTAEEKPEGIQLQAEEEEETDGIKVLYEKYNGNIEKTKRYEDIVTRHQQIEATSKLIPVIERALTATALSIPRPPASAGSSVCPASRGSRSARPGSRRHRAPGWGRRRSARWSCPARTRPRP